MELNPRQLQQLARVAAAEAHGNVPLSLQVTPQKGQGNAEEQPETRLPREVKAWLYSKCATEGCKCKAS